MRERDFLHFLKYKISQPWDMSIVFLRVFAGEEHLGRNDAWNSTVKRRAGVSPAGLVGEDADPTKTTARSAVVGGLACKVPEEMWDRSCFDELSTNGLCERH